jgi:hypothetical protein
MRNKDQIILEKIYKKILAETDTILSSSFNQQQTETVKSVVHDILNDIQPHVFDLDRDTYKLALKTLIDRLSDIVNRN